jgi:energy-coupling factor transporter ATP-binding protein EcfA2
MDTPDFSGALRAETLTFPRGGGAMPYLDRVGFTLAPGECLVIVGAAGSGKSSLLHALSGQRMAPIGSVFYDESVLRSLSPAALSHWVGTLPQRADLIAGSLADNIACFDPDRQDGQVIAAATAAGVHGLIAALPEGFESDLSVSPLLLSAGQVQRVALARALYRQPRYLFLDEPNALLDGDGERALLQTLLRLKAAGTTIVMVLHRSGLMGMADKILQLDQGRVVDFGPRAEVLARLSGNHRRLRVPPLATSLHDLRDWVAAQFTRASDEPFSQKAQIVAQELFHLALEVSASQSSPPQELEFSLKFLNDLECELRMVGDASLDLGEKMVSVRKYLAAGHAPQGGLSRDEQALAALEQIGRSVTLQRQEEFCAYQVAVSATEEGSVPANMWRAQ